MESLAKVRSLPDLRLLPAHGPIATSSHTRADELLVHHEERLDLCLAALRGRVGLPGATAYDVAGELPWTRHERSLSDLDEFNGALASMETKAHLELLVARGLAEARTEDGVRIYRAGKSTLPLSGA
jgi:glyoxylase-like metal-dependent hydrolase (beta-lactamase superfamily II)